MTNLSIHYSLEFSESRKLEYTVELDSKTLKLLKPLPKLDPAPWTKLDVEKCSVCPLKSSESPYCPVALNIEQLVDAIKNEISHTRVKVSVTTAERSYFKEVAVQEALGALFGLIIATSGCPVMNYLKPMARYHLPFASLEESIVRSVSMHLLRQYFSAQKGDTADFSLKSLDAKYEEIQKVNIGLNKRISTVIKSGDASNNTVTAFHAISKLLSMSIQRNLQNYSYLFADS